MIVVWLIIGFAVGVASGLAIGRLQSASEQVDRILREETRFRHPASRQRVTSAQIIERAQRLSQGERLGPAPWFVDQGDEVRAKFMPARDATPAELSALRGAQSVSVPPFTLRTDANSSPTIETVSEVLTRENKRAVCGRPTMTNLGWVRCLMAPGHDGDC